MVNNNEKAIVIGKAAFINFPEFEKWCDTEEADEFFSIKNIWTDCLYHLQGEIQGVCVSKLTEYVDRKYDYRTNKYLLPIKRCWEYINRFSSPEKPLSFNLLYEHDKFDIIAFGNMQALIPVGFLKKTLYKDYSDFSLSDIRQQTLAGNETALISADSHLFVMSHNDMQKQISETASAKNSLEEAMDDVKNARVEGLSELQQEIDKKVAELEERKARLLDELRRKEAELNAKVEQLNNELFMLESEIYSIRCFMGEVVDFIKLKSGAAAPVDAPITLFQKMRFLDEELGKLVSLYDFDFGKAKLFEELLQKRDDIVEVFCPNDKCVSLVRVSKTNIHYGYDFDDMLNEYEVYHGRTIGILIRNGENLYIGWTDEEKINIPDNMFYTPESKVVSEEDAAKTKTTSVKEMVSRYFIFSILQGALCNDKLLALPDSVKASFTRPSEYIIYSAADTWLCDNKYGTFMDIVDKCNSRIGVGDFVLSLQYLSDGNYNSSYRSFEYDRDYNDSHRTHDVSMGDGKIYKITLVEENEDAQFSWNRCKYFISLEKSNYDHIYRNGHYYDRKRLAYARFRVYDDEFINLTYMNSTWLKYVITTQNLGGGRSRLSNFAETVRYLNKALAFVKKREATEREFLSVYVKDITDETWVALSEWKLATGVRKINDYQAKRFARSLNA